MDIAPSVGLDPYLNGTDIPTFEMSCARLPNAIFSIIIDDLQRLEAQYGRVEKHMNEEARSRYLSGVGSPSHFGNLVTVWKPSCNRIHH
jgi:hypothetical protein